jgi:hypothetical protein
MLNGKSSIGSCDNGSCHNYCVSHSCVCDVGFRFNVIKAGVLPRLFKL